MYTPYHFKLSTLTLALFTALGLSTAQAGCGGGPAVFNVFDNGKIGITNQQGYVNESDTCKVSFTGGGSINVEPDDYFSPSQNGDGVTATCGVEPTGTTLNQLTLPTFPSDTRDMDISIKNQGYVINVGGVVYQRPGNTPLRWCKNPSNDNNKCFNNEKGMKDYTEDDGATFPTSTNSKLVISNASQHVYDDISIDSAEAYFKYDGSNPYVIDSLTMTNRSVITFDPGVYFINDFDINDACVLNVSDAVGDGSGKAKIYIKDGSNSKFIGNQSCINMAGVTTTSQCGSKGTPSQSTLEGQHPEKLGFYIYEGDVLFGDTAFVSASIYVHSGDMTMTGNSNTAFAGEILGANIHLGNQPSHMHYKDTEVFTELYDEVVVSKSGEYSLAAPAVPKTAITGDLVFMTYQTQFNTSSTPQTKFAGYLKAYPLLANAATSSTATWTFGATDIDGSSTNNPKERLSTNWDSYIGLPNGTQPVIYKNQVMMTSSDGNLYVVDRANGSYVSKWTPPLIATYLTSIAPAAGDTTAVTTTKNAAYETFLKSDPMEGQLAVVALSGRTEDSTADNTLNPKGGYVFGTLKGGAIHFALSVANDGAISSSWVDNRKSDDSSASTYADLTAVSPNAAAPVAYAGTHVIYIVNNRRIVREIGKTSIAYDDNSELDLDSTAAVSRPTSTPLVADNKGTLTLFLGGQKGEIVSGTPTGTLSALDVATGDSFGATEPVRFITYTQMNTNQYLTAQSEKRITVFRKKYGTSEKWTEIWTAYVGGSAVSDPDASTQPSIQSLPSGSRISAKSLVLGGKVFVPVEGAENETTCLADAYQYIYDLDPVANQLYKTFYYDSERKTYITLGSGQAFSPQAMVFEGKLHAQGSSEQNAAVDGGRVGGGLDNPIELRAVKSLIGRRGWKELIED